eukprot:189838-Chlamydomonas_euryale.AAC.4
MRPTQSDLAATLDTCELFGWKLSRLQHNGNSPYEPHYIATRQAHTLHRHYVLTKSLSRLETAAAISGTVRNSKNENMKVQKEIANEPMLTELSWYVPSCPIRAACTGQQALSSEEETSGREVG